MYLLVRICHTFPFLLNPQGWEFMTTFIWNARFLGLTLEVSYSKTGQSSSCYIKKRVNPVYELLWTFYTQDELPLISGHKRPTFPPGSRVDWNKSTSLAYYSHFLKQSYQNTVMIFCCTYENISSHPYPNEVTFIWCINFFAWYCIPDLLRITSKYMAIMKWNKLDISSSSYYLQSNRLK